MSQLGANFHFLFNLETVSQEYWRCWDGTLIEVPCAIFFGEALLIPCVKITADIPQFGIYGLKKWKLPSHHHLRHDPI